MSIFRVFFIFWLAVVQTLVSNHALAETKMAVVDIRAALFASNSAKEFSESLKKEFSEEEKRLREAFEGANKVRERLSKDAAIMSETERSKLAAEAEEKAQEFNYLKNKFQSAIAKREDLFLKESQPKLNTALKKIVEKEKIDLVLPRKVAIHAEANLDITAKLIEALNTQ